MLRTELATEAWRAWVKDKPFQSEDTAKGFIAGFNFCLNGKVKVEGGDKGELISANFSLQDKLDEAKTLIERMLPLMPRGYNDLGNCDFIEELRQDAEQFLKED